MIEKIKAMLPLAVADKVSVKSAETPLELILKQDFPPYIIDGKGFVPSGSERITASDLEGTVLRLCDYSLQKREHNLKNCCITLEGGHRASVSGSFDGERIRRISAISIRIANEVPQASAAITADGLSLLVCGQPMCGKTTFLRDYAKRLSRLYKTAIIDERGELTACFNGRSPFKFGAGAFFLEGCPREKGFEAAIRCLSPRFIVCDELFAKSDAELVLEAVRSGVKVCASYHIRDAAELKTSDFYKLVRERGLFEQTVLLNRTGESFTASRLAI